MDFGIVGIIVVTMMILVGLWDRFRRSTIADALLNTPGLDDICQEYLDTIARMSSGTVSMTILQALDSERQWLHNEILRRLGLDRSSALDVEEFARRYRGR